MPGGAICRRGNHICSIHTSYFPSSDVGSWEPWEIGSPLPPSKTPAFPYPEKQGQSCSHTGKQDRYTKGFIKVHKAELESCQCSASSPGTEEIPDMWEEGTLDLDQPQHFQLSLGTVCMDRKTYFIGPNPPRVHAQFLLYGTYARFNRGDS